MQGTSHFPRRAGLLGLLAVLVLTFGLMQSAPTQAQTQPTATPNDPSWLSYAAARNAIEDKFNVDLTIVRNWEFSEANFTNGINDCNTNVDPQAPQAYYGLRYVLTAMDGRQFEARYSSGVVVACDKVTAAAAAAPAAPANPDPNLPPPVAGSAAVGGFELGGHVLELNGNTVNLVKRAGMHWVKTQLRYSLGQDPGVAAGFINAAHANGLKAFVGIVGDKSQMGDFGGYINSFSQFAAGVAALGADAIEVWNEPNIDREWPAESINGANYTQLLAGAFNAIKSRNGNTIVISGAPAPTGFFGSAGCGSGGCNDDVYMQQMAAAGAGNYMDCVGLHYNEGIISPTQSGGDPRGGYPSYYFGSMLARGYNPFGGKQVCFTELGYLSGQGFNQAIPSSFGWASNTTVAQQAQWLAEAATSAAQSGKVRLMIVWNVDFPFFTDTDPMGGYAMYRPDGSCPSCDSLRGVMGG